jgi:AcrR family transcriptional regulator
MQATTMDLEEDSTRPTGKGRPKGDHAARKQEIAEATWRVIADKGVAGATIRRIARETGYSTGVLSHYFSDKNEILEFAVESLFALWLSEYRKTEISDISAEDELRHLLNSLLPTDEISKFFWSLWMHFLAGAVDNSKHAEIIADFQVHMRDRIARIVRRGVNEGAFNPGMDSQVMIDILNATIDGFCITFPFEQSHYDSEYLQEIMERLIQIIRVRDA